MMWYCFKYYIERMITMIKDDSKAKKFLEKRENFMATYNGNEVLSETIPSVAKQLIHDEFGIKMHHNSIIPILFTVGWTEVLKYVGSQNADEYSIEVGGVQLEYVTEYSESDKPTNIVPQMYHKREPSFSKREIQNTTGASFTEKLLEKYNTWRSVNVVETITDLENKIFKIMLQEYGINLINPVAVFPILAATYVAGVNIAKETGETVNMYNIFEIDVYNDNIILTPLATVKQWLKNDSKKIE